MTQRIAAILSVPLLIGVLALYPGRRQPVVTAQMVEIKTNDRHDYLRPVTGQHGSSPQFGILPPLSHLFAGDVRQVELNGEAYFDVTHHPERFIVSTPHHSQVEVYGTSFNVEAYGNETPIPPRLSKAA